MVTQLFYWLSQRLRDLAQWPINLVRDFPARLLRLVVTVSIAFQALRREWPLFQEAESKRAWWSGQRESFFLWIHRLASELFDLLGGPEIGQFFMHLITNTTPLTSKEIAMISSVLGDDALRFEDVRVAEGGLFDLIFKYNGNLAFATWHTINMPRTGKHTRANLPIVVHELTHVYQYETVGTRYLGEAIYMLIKTKRDCYNYGGRSGLVDAHSVGKQYCDYNREQQAQLTQDFFTLRERGEDISPYEPFMAQVRAKQL